MLIELPRDEPSVLVYGITFESKGKPGQATSGALTEIVSAPADCDNHRRLIHDFFRFWLADRQ